MSDLISPVPVTVAMATTERQARQDDLPQGEAAAEAAVTDEPVSAPAQPPISAPAPTIASRPSATLFTASILGQRVRSVASDLAAIRQARRQGWVPPHSELRLKDKTV